MKKNTTVKEEQKEAEDHARNQAKAQLDNIREGRYNFMTLKTLMEKAPVDWEKTVDAMSSDERYELKRELEGIAERALSLAGYLYARFDRGHSSAMKQANRNGKIVWMKAFGYNGYHDLTI